MRNILAGIFVLCFGALNVSAGDFQGGQIRQRVIVQRVAQPVYRPQQIRVQRIAQPQYVQQIRVQRIQQPVRQRVIVQQVQDDCYGGFGGAVGNGGFRLNLNSGLRRSTIIRSPLIGRPRVIIGRRGFLFRR